MIDNTPDFPLHFIMITLNSDCVSLDLYQELLRKLNRKPIKPQSARSRASSCSIILSERINLTVPVVCSCIGGN
jgi:hypothetical protein